MKPRRLHSETSLSMTAVSAMSPVVRVKFNARGKIAKGMQSEKSCREEHFPAAGPRNHLRGIYFNDNRLGRRGKRLGTCHPNGGSSTTTPAWVRMKPSRGEAGRTGPETEQDAPQPATTGRERSRRGGRRSERRSASDASLSRELADFLVEFSIVLHKRAMYPSGHPQLDASADRFVRRLDTLLARRESVTLGVARNQLVIEKVTTDPNNALLRDLARRLHRHRIASVRFMAGTSLEEIDSLLGALSADPSRGEGPLGPRLRHLDPWAHIELHPASYDRLALESDASANADDPAQQRDRWIELAQAAVSDDPPPPDGEESLIVT